MRSAAVIGAGVNGRAAARTFEALGRDVVAVGRRRGAGARRGGRARRRHRRAASSEALAADVVVTVTPGREDPVPEGSLRPGQHVSLMGADGPGKAEIAVAELRARAIFCDDWEQASHGGELAAAVEAGAIDARRRDRARRRARRRGRGSPVADEITIFDSTGLAIQDLAIAIAALERADELDLPTMDV